MTLRKVRVGIVGAGYIAGAHSAGYRSVGASLPDSAVSVELLRVADTDIDRANRLATAWSWNDSAHDWRTITRADDIDLVDICVPNVLHAEIALDALAHSKHVVCEKPLAADVESARQMARAADGSASLTQACFYYRTWPAIAFSKQLIDEGQIGQVVHLRGWMLQDYASDPSHEMGWRLDQLQAGAGALGDLGSHIFDVARYLAGDVSRICALARPTVGRGITGQTPEDLAAALVEFATGASGVLEASWAASGHKADLGVDVIGSTGAIRFSWERANEVEVLTSDSRTGGFERVLLGPGHPSVGNIVAVPGQGLGYRDAYTIGLARMIEAITMGESHVEPSFWDGLRACELVAAAIDSAETSDWIKLTAPLEPASAQATADQDVARRGP